MATMPVECHTTALVTGLHQPFNFFAPNSLPTHSKYSMAPAHRNPSCFVLPVSHFPGNFRGWTHFVSEQLLQVFTLAIKMPAWFQKIYRPKKSEITIQFL